MKTIYVSLFVCAVTAVATINAKCYYCTGDNNQYRQEIEYDNLKSWERFDRVQQNTDRPYSVVDKFRIIQKIVQNYPKYMEKSQQAVRFSDPLKLIDYTEILGNGVVEYKNAKIHGLDSARLLDVNFDRIDRNTFSVNGNVKRAYVTGDYSAATNAQNGDGQYEIKLTDVKFEARFLLIGFLEAQQDVGAESITCDQQDATYTDEGLVLKELKNENAESLGTRDYYRNYLDKVVRDRLAKELTASFMPLIAARLEQKFYAAVLFPTVDVRLPQSVEIVAPGVQAKISETLLHDLKSTNKIQKMANFTVNRGVTEMVFFFAAFDLRGTTKWNLDYTTGTAYRGRAMFSVDNVQTVIVAAKSDGKINVKGAKTTVNGLKFILNTDDNCESIRIFAHQRVPKVLEHGLNDYINRKSEAVLRNQIDLLGEQYQ